MDVVRSPLKQRATTSPRFEYPEVALRFGTSKEGSVILKRNGYGLLEFHLGGSLRCRPDSIRGGLPSPLNEQYERRLRKVTGMTGARYAIVLASDLGSRAKEVGDLVAQTLHEAREEAR